MFKSGRVIRIIFVFGLALCIAMWISSYFFAAGVVASSAKSSGAMVVSSRGAILIMWGSHLFDEDGHDFSRGIHFSASRDDGEKSVVDNTGFLGFWMRSNRIGDQYWGFFRIPLWFPTTTFLGVLLWSFDRARRGETGPAFPVDSEKK